jgi:hypothetical protein
MHHAERGSIAVALSVPEDVDGPTGIVSVLSDTSRRTSSSCTTRCTPPIARVASADVDHVTDRRHNVCGAGSRRRLARPA